MSQWRAGATALATELGQVDGIGKVYVGEEDVKTLAQIQELAVAPATEDELLSEQARINIWQITRIGVSIVAGSLPQHQNYRVHRLAIRGYYGEGEGTYERWHDIIDGVIDSLDRLAEIPTSEGNRDLLEVIDLNITAIGHSSFGVYSCHSVEARVDLREWRKGPLRHSV